MFKIKTNSIQFKFLATVISAMVAITVFIGGLSIYEVDNFIQKQTASYVSANCKNEALKLNGTFENMEKSVHIMDSYIMDCITGIEDITSADKRDEIIDRVDDMFADVAKHTNEAIAYYFRFDPEISNSTSGLFYTKINGGRDYIKFEPTDISIYDREDTEHVGWFWQPYDAGKPVWMEPYYNQNNDVLMISYVMPMYLDGRFIGVVGMDFDYDYMLDIVHQIKVYENGYAHIEMDGKTITHGDGETHEADGEYLRVSEELVNGMTLVLSASYDDLRQIRYEIGFKILFVVLFLVTLFTIVVILLVKRIVVPLGKLADASKSLSEGNYDVDIADSDTYEVKLLSTAFENMIVHLREHEKLQRLLTYTDSLTGLRNTTSYKAWVDSFNKDIEEKPMKFGVVVLDINCLKETNDHFGHDVGNKLIVSASRIIASTFKRSPVFRIGGDEFVVILQNKDLEDRERLFDNLAQSSSEELVETGYEMISFSIAMGYSEYNPETDKQFVDVFNRADEAMYVNKREMKNLNASGV